MDAEYEALVTDGWVAIREGRWIDARDAFAGART